MGGLTEDQAKAKASRSRRACSLGRLRRAIANGRDEGFTKLLFDDSPKPTATAASWAAAWSARMPAT
jgi:dihydrolipoamide dehydrogenase